MKKNLKVNIFWLGLVLIGYLLMTVLVSAGVLNAFRSEEHTSELQSQR